MSKRVTGSCSSGLHWQRILHFGEDLLVMPMCGPRLLKHAIELNKPTMLLNLGPTRAHGVPEVDIVEAASSDVLRAATRTLAKDLKGEAGRVVNRLLESGVVTPPPDDMEDRAPRAAG
ncbi:NAD-dependent histone deacetylase SIR2 [Rhizoctonia solani]|uniref:NAD-dependent histone deacetylase SIR2 n=1 Tax=Rhizoctonia solani TaxID=456999 RepID=A0A8H8ST41_9AGAM|nr:NAD-dependent histone deacetylase SIR2 [Rhizoctonia solani]QRW16679.1 NAD-dependent histone deacetylase SIR2 [Rhizoctonia solani]